MVLDLLTFAGVIGSGLIVVAYFETSRDGSLRRIGFIRSLISSVLS